MVTFSGTTVAINNLTFNANCVPEVNRLTFTGPAALLAPSGQGVTLRWNTLF